MTTGHSKLRPALLARVGLLLFAGAGHGAIAEEESALSLDDFSVGRTLIIRESSILQSVLLDYDVYRRSVEHGLADIRVFNGQGEPVPYSVRRRLPRLAEVEEFHSVPFFLLDEKGAGGAGGAAGGNPHSMSRFRIDAELSDSGAILRIRQGALVGGSTEMSAEASQAAGWLIDTSELDRAITHLEFKLSDENRDFVTRLRLESSDDLVRFKTVRADVALVRLDQAGHQIERMSFEIPATRARYLRFSAVGGNLPATLVGVRVKRSRHSAKGVFSRTVLDGRWDVGATGTVLYDLEASPPIDTVRVMLSATNSIVEGRLESAPTPEGPWRLRQGGVFYWFERGGEIRNAPATWNDSRDRYLRLVTSSRGGGLHDGEPPALEVIWQPEQLLFLHREEDGPGASTLAIGRAGVADGSFAASALLRMVDRSLAEVERMTGRLGPESTLAGDRVLQGAEPIPWKSYGLWALLLIAVAFVLGLSVRLMRTAED